MNQNRLQLRAEKQVLSVPHKIKRLDSHAVARQHQPFRRFRIQRDGKHAAQTRKARRVPLDERTQNSFRIAVGVEAMAECLQFAPQFHVVVNFAVEHNGDIAVVRDNRLVAATEVNDLEPRRAHRAHARLKHSLLVRPTMNQRGGCVLNAIGIRHPTLMGETDDSTQRRTPQLLAKSADNFRDQEHGANYCLQGRNVIVTVFFRFYKLGCKS